MRCVQLLRWIRLSRSWKILQGRYNQGDFLLKLKFGSIYDVLLVGFSPTRTFPWMFRGPQSSTVIPNVNESKDVTQITPVKLLISIETTGMWCLVTILVAIAVPT